MTPKSSNLHLGSLLSGYRKICLLNFHNIFFLTSTMYAQVHQKNLWWWFASFWRYGSSKFRFFFSMNAQDFSKKLWLETIILILHDLSNVDIVLSDFLNQSWATCGPRAVCGPRGSLCGPPNFTHKNVANPNYVYPLSSTYIHTKLSPSSRSPEGLRAASPRSN